MALGQEMAERTIVGRIVRRFQRVLLLGGRSEIGRMAQPRQLVQARTTQHDGRVERDERGNQDLTDHSSSHHITLGPISDRDRNAANSLQ